MNSDSQKSTIFAEIIKSSLYQWQGCCWEWDAAPAFGSLVTIETSEKILFGIVFQVETGSKDPARIAYAYKKSHAELKRDQPQIFEFLQTTFLCLPLGYKDKKNCSSIYQIPPEPPSIHAFIASATEEVMAEFFGNSSYLYVLFGLSSSIAYLDELLLALLKRQADSGLLTEEKVLYFIQTFSVLTGNNYQRLKLFLQRLNFKE